MALCDNRAMVTVSAVPVTARHIITAHITNTVTLLGAMLTCIYLAVHLLPLSQYCALLAVAALSTAVCATVLFSVSNHSATTAYYNSGSTIAAFKPTLLYSRGRAHSSPQVYIQQAHNLHK